MKKNANEAVWQKGQSVHACISEWLWCVKRSRPLIWLQSIAAKIFPPHPSLRGTDIYCAQSAVLSCHPIPMYVHQNWAGWAGELLVLTISHHPQLPVPKAQPISHVIAHPCACVCSGKASCSVPSLHSLYLIPTQPVHSGPRHKASLRASLPSSSNMNDSKDLPAGHLNSYLEQVNI